MSNSLSSFKIVSPPKVLLYTDPHTKVRVPYLQSALHNDLINGSNIELHPVHRQDFSAMIKIQKPDAIFIPENRESISYHMKDFSPETIKVLRNYVHEGGTLVLFGGASHYAMKKITWYWDNGEIIYRGPKETFSFVSGTMDGPHFRHPPSPNTPLQFHGCFKVPLIVTDEKNNEHHESCWQGNGGAFTIDEKEHPDHTILAFYKEIDAKHIAAVDVPFGNKGGRFILCSVMPHYRTRQESILWDKILTRVENRMSGKLRKTVLNKTP